MDANEYYLNEHLNKEAEEERKQEAKEAQIEEMANTAIHDSYSEYYALKPKNIIEAIAEMDENNFKHFAYYLEQKNLDGLRVFLSMTIFGYWREVAILDMKNE